MRLVDMLSLLLNSWLESNPWYPVHSSWVIKALLHTHEKSSQNDGQNDHISGYILHHSMVIYSIYLMDIQTTAQVHKIATIFLYFLYLFWLLHYYLYYSYHGIIVIIPVFVIHSYYYTYYIVTIVTKVNYSCSDYMSHMSLVFLYPSLRQRHEEVCRCPAGGAIRGVSESLWFKPLSHWGSTYPLVN